MKVAKWWQRKEKSAVQCNLCPRNCYIKPDEKGFCATRKNIDGTLYTLVYGYPSAINIDPIEKKPLFHFYPGTKIFSIGTIGCNLECQFCQNFEIARQNYKRKGREFLDPKDVVDLARNNECDSIAFTYNEPTVFGEYIIDIAKEAHKIGMKTIMVTNGFINPKPLSDIYRHIDAANIDLKAISEEFYKKLCHGKLSPVLTAIREMYQMGVFIEITNLVIPEYNDDVDKINKLLTWLAQNLDYDVPLHFSAFHPAYKMTDVRRTPKKKLDQIRQTALDMGFHYVYEGNVMTTKYDNTYCPSCNRLLIERQLFTVVENALKGSHCQCGQEINIKLKV